MICYKTLFLNKEIILEQEYQHIYIRASIDIDKQQYRVASNITESHKSLKINHKQIITCKKCKQKC